MQAFDVPFCKQHPQLLANYYYLEQPAKRVCVLCKVNNSLLFTTTALANLMRSSAIGVPEGENIAMSRHEALSLLSKKVLGDYGREDEELIREMMKRVQEQNKRYKQVKARVQARRSQLHGLKKMMKYFDTLKEGELYSIKMNLSSEEGMKKFYNKCRHFAALINKGVHNQFKKIQSKLQQDSIILYKMQQQSILHRLQSIIDQRNIELAKRHTPTPPRDLKVQLQS